MFVHWRQIFFSPTVSHSSDRRPTRSRKPIVRHAQLVPTDRTLKRRLGIAGSIFFVGLVVAGARLVQLQAVQKDYWQERADSLQNVPVRVPTFRRTIVDRHPLDSSDVEILAIDRPTYQLWSRPYQFDRQEGHSPETMLAEILAPILEMPEAEVRSLLDRPQSTLLKQRLSESEARRIRREIYGVMGREGVNLSGWELMPTQERLYPQGQDAAEVVGYIQLDSERRGQAGVELAWQDSLAIKPAETVSVTTDGFRRLMADDVPSEVMQTDEQVLQLTLDMRLQRTAREALREGVSAFNAERGTAIVLDPHTGEIIAMASEPTYDPNYFFDYIKEESDYQLFRNWAVSDLYEPGSTFKPITVALALEAGAIAADTHVEDTGSLTVGGWPIYNYDYGTRGAPGSISVSQVLQRSSNIGTIRIVELMGRSAFYAGLQDIGLGNRSGVDLPFEPSSFIKNRRQFIRYRVEAATTGFGQGVSLTPLQLAQLHSTIANGGYRVTPHVVRGLVDVDSHRLEPISRPGRERVLSPETTRTVRQMMLDVVELGTGQSVAIPGYQIAGKTGTAQKAAPNGAGYLPPSQRVTSFVGYFPALDPQYVILAVVDNPQGVNAFGSTVAAPIVRSIVQEIVAGEMLRPQTQLAREP